MILKEPTLFFKIWYFRSVRICIKRSTVMSVTERIDSCQFVLSISYESKSRFWNMKSNQDYRVRKLMKCTLLDAYRSFEGTYIVHLHIRKLIVEGGIIILCNICIRFIQRKTSASWKVIVLTFVTPRAPSYPIKSFIENNEKNPALWDITASLSSKTYKTSPA
jgi:hypothetical protein